MPPLAAAAWLEGFLKSCGSLLVHDQALLGLIDSWLGHLSGDSFQTILPLLRRTFSSFTPPERSRVASSVAHGLSPATQASASPVLDLDFTRALPAVATVARMLGLPEPS
jgi:Family of unknown function (DUF5682)